MKRPYATHYFEDIYAYKAAHVSHGACASEEGAIRASVVRLFLGQYEKCIVVDRASGVTLYTVIKHQGKLSVQYGSGVEAKKWRK